MLFQFPIHGMLTAYSIAYAMMVGTTTTVRGGLVPKELTSYVTKRTKRVLVMVRVTAFPVCVSVPKDGVRVMVKEPQATFKIADIGCRSRSSIVKALWLSNRSGEKRFLPVVLFLRQPVRARS